MFDITHFSMFSWIKLKFYIKNNVLNFIIYMNHFISSKEIASQSAISIWLSWS